jgi:nitroreductase/FMN reductase [NAD(P)H]
MPRDPAPLLAARLGEAPEGLPAEIPDALAALLDRRVTRRFRDAPLDEATLALVLAGAQSAPSKSDLQQLSIVVLREPARIAAIADWIGSMPWIKDAPVFLVFCADMRRGQRLCEAAGQAHRNDTADGFVNAVGDAALALGFALMAADAIGLGACPVSYVRNHLERVGPLLGLPRGVFPLAGCALGWPAAREEVSRRLPPQIVVHRERYQDALLPEALAAHDAARGRKKPRYPEVHGPAPEGCTWSENAARQLSVPERLGTGPWLRQNGFSLD